MIKNYKNILLQLPTANATSVCDVKSECRSLKTDVTSCVAASYKSSLCIFCKEVDCFNCEVGTASWLDTTQCGIVNYSSVLDMRSVVANVDGRGSAIVMIGLPRIYRKRIPSGTYGYLFGDCDVTTYNKNSIGVLRDVGHTLPRRSSH